MSFVRTVCGDVPASELGRCYGHEHLMGQPPPDCATPDLTLDSEHAALHALSHFRTAGGDALVEMTTRDYGRDPAGLRRLSENSGVHVIAATGFNKDKFSRRYVKDRTARELADTFARDVTEGIGETDVRAGVLKAASTLDEISDAAQTVFRAVACAHRETGAPISTHTEAGTMALEQIDMLTADGVPPEHITIGHLDRRLDWAYHRKIAETGVFMGFDQISKEKYASDRTRIDFILRLFEECFGQQVLLSGDLARRSYWPAYGTGGGPGFTYILWRFVPWLRKEGLSEDAIRALLIDNPARAFAFA
jgi:phosphotriesterase-related protein